jgi:adenosylhomocysteine nucleosidase
MKIAILIPTQKEHNYFLNSCLEQGLAAEDATIGRLPVVRLPELDVTVCRGGLGKVEFAVSTRHLIDAGPAWELVVCAGAAGRLDGSLSVGDIVVATETIEHDIRNKFGKPRLPRYPGDEKALRALRRLDASLDGFRLHFGAIASGDEDVVEEARQAELKARTGALAVAWEGAGGARACQFSHTPFIELRGISDGANPDAPSDFEKNLPLVMHNLAVLIRAFAGL